jgi:hypothetical protein
MPKMPYGPTNLESKALDAGITLEDLKSQIQNANQMLVYLTNLH